MSQPMNHNDWNTRDIHYRVGIAPAPESPKTSPLAKRLDTSRGNQPNERTKGLIPDIRINVESDESK